jgi:cyclic beta-1,2-glucan synthetase
MYRAGLEWLLGFRVRGEFLHLDPCIPRGWRRFEIVFQYRSARYELAVENPRGVSRGVSSVEVDGTAPVSGGGPLRLTDDGATHKVRVVLG